LRQVRELRLFGYRPPGGVPWGPLMLDSALTCRRLRKQAGRAPLKINELRTDPISFPTLPKLDVAGSSPGARFSNSPSRGPRTTRRSHGSRPPRGALPLRAAWALRTRGRRGDARVAPLGLSRHDTVLVPDLDMAFALRLARYCARNPVALERLEYDASARGALPLRQARRTHRRDGDRRPAGAAGRSCNYGVTTRPMFAARSGASS